MNSNYGESVKFYEKISHLHNQLKNYEEEQFTLEEEFGRLCKDTGTGDSMAMTDVSMSNIDRDVSPRGGGGGGIVQMGPRGILKIDGLSIEEKRRRRNQAILEKMKELESNASVFAARSEKLRIMRAEYEILVKKYMQGRQSSSSQNNNRPSFTLVQNGRLGNGDENPHKSVVSIGVNTNISGSIKPTQNLKFPDSTSTNILQMHSTENGGGGEENEKDFPDLKKDFEHNRNSFRSLYPENPSNCHYNTHQQEHQQQRIHQIDAYPRTSYLMDKLYSKSTDGLNNPYDPNDNFSTRTIQLRQPPPPNHQLRRPNSDENLLDNEDSLASGKLDNGHNSYFDLSTTSDSDLTSTAGGVGGEGMSNLMKRANNMLPIKIQLDDTTTQSDTISLSIQLPPKLTHPSKTFSKLGPIQILNLSTDQSQSESTAAGGGGVLQNLEINSRDGEKGSSNKRKEFGHANQIWNGGRDEADVDVDGGGNEADEEPGNDMGGVSDSMTTSCGDSVMDSVQNRTLNESLPRLPQDNHFELPTSHPHPPPAALLPSHHHDEEKDVDETIVSENPRQSQSQSQPLVDSHQPPHPSTKKQTRTGNNNNEPDSQLVSKKNGIVNNNRESPTGVTRTTTTTMMMSTTSMLHGTRDEFGFGSELFSNPNLREVEGMTNKFLDTKPKDDDKDELDGLDWVLRNKMLQSPEVGRRGLEEMGGGKEGLTGKMEKEVENKKLVPSSPDRPKTAAAPTSTSRRVRIKLDYEDSDSESLEMPGGRRTAQQAKGGGGSGGGDNRIGSSLKAVESQGPTKGNQVDATDDDDFDDFFDI